MAANKYTCTDCGKAFSVHTAHLEKEGEESEKLFCPKCGSSHIVTSGDQIDACCSGGEACGIGCKPDENNNVINGTGSVTGDCCD